MGEHRPITRRAGDRSPRLWAVRIGAAVALAAAIALMPYHLVGGPSGSQLDRVRADLARTREETAILRERNAELRREIHALRSQPGFIEDIARRELGMVRPGELILRIEGPPTAHAEASP